MWQRTVLLLILIASSSPTLLAADGFLGVYSHLATGMTSVEGELVGYVPKSELTLKISVANEEGSEELFLDGGIREALQIEVKVDGEPQTGLVLDWASADRRYAFFGGLPPTPSQEGVLEPGVGLETRLAVRRTDGKSFAAGRYQLQFRIEPSAVRFADGSAWQGRGGLGGTRFELLGINSAEASATELKIRARDALLGERYPEAAELFAEVVELEPTDVDGWSGLGASLHHLGDHQSAAESLEKVMPTIIEQRMNSTLPLLLAESYVNLGELEKAERALQAVIVEPDVAVKLEELQLKVARAAPNP